VAGAPGWGAFGARVTAVELDPAIVEVARSHFGLRVAAAAAAAAAGASVAGGAAPAAPAGDGTVAVVVGDGLDFVKGIAEPPAAGGLDALLVDVDAKDRDMQLGLSFPPAAFVGRPFLRAARAALAPGGVLVVNLGSRSKALFAGSLAAIEKEFGAARVVALRPDDEDEGEGDDGGGGGGGGGGDLNRVVVAGGAPGGWPSAAAAEARALALFGSARTAATLRGLGERRG